MMHEKQLMKAAEQKMAKILYITRLEGTRTSAEYLVFRRIVILWLVLTPTFHFKRAWP